MEENKRKMWQFPWKYKESIAFVLGIICIGIMLQLTVGKFNFYLLHFPVNVVLAIAFVLFLIAISFARKNSFYQWISGVPFSVTTIAAFLALTLIMGLTPQVVKIHEHDLNIFTRLGFSQMTTSWPFVLIYILVLFSLGMLIARRLRSFKKGDYAFYLNHIGLWILLLAGGLGAADMKRYVMHVYEGETEYNVYNKDKEPLELPIAIHLNDFIMEEYPPKLTIINKDEGTPLPLGEPAFFQLDEKRPDGTLMDWNIHLDEYIHDAVRNSDSTYHEVHMPGSSPAAKVTLTHRQTGEKRSGWVASATMSQLYMMLPVDSIHSVVMTVAEPKRYASDIKVYVQDGDSARIIHKTIEVNDPLRVGSWTIYQYSYDNEAGKMSTYSSLELVYDPWLYLVYLGIALLGIGSVCMLWSGNKKGRNKE